MEKRDVVFFFGAKNLNGEFSNHFMADFEIFGHVYCCVEQYMMAQKALIFKDYKRLNEILNSKNPVEMRNIGREVAGFDSQRWDRVKVKVVKNAVRAKFSQNEALKAKLLATGKKMLVESNPNDRVWGIGFTKSDKMVMEKFEKWGENLLGKILSEVRDELKEGEKIKEVA